MKNKIFYLIIVIIVIFTTGSLGKGDFFGVLSAWGYGSSSGGGMPSRSVKKVSPSGVNTPMTVSSIQEGVLTQVFDDRSRVVIEVPNGAVEEKTTFSVTSVPLSQAIAPLDPIGAFLVGGRVFNIMAMSENGRVTDFGVALNITITIPEISQDISDLAVYYFNRDTNSWRIVPGATFDQVSGKVFFLIKHLTEFAVMQVGGKPYELATNNSFVSDKYDPVFLKEGTLLRGSGPDVYIVENHGRKKILNLYELRRYIGQTIYSVTDDVLESLPYIASEPSAYVSSPASDYCEKQGGILEVKQNDGGGELIECKFSNAQTCEVWSFFRGDCGKELEGGSLGKKTYPDEGTLIRGTDGRIFLITKGAKAYIPSKEELGAYRGKPIVDVSEEVIAFYPDIKMMSEGNLIRQLDMRIYVIKNGLKQHIKSLYELAQYAGQKIYNIADSLNK